MVIWEGERTHFLHLGCLERECIKYIRSIHVSGPALKQSIKHLEASRPIYWGVSGAEPPRKKGSYILHVSVLSRI